MTVFTPQPLPQANAFFAVNHSDATMNYDLDRNEKLGDPLGYETIPAKPEELKAINDSSARTTGVDYNYYIVNDVDVPIAITQFNPNIVMSCDYSHAPFLLIMAHECGHLLMKQGGHTDSKKSYLMHSNADGNAGTQIQKEFWRNVNK